MKKTWESPKLIILVRNNPQEAVLSVCKGYLTDDVGAAANGVSPQSYYGTCTYQPAANIPNGCMTCQSIETS